MKTKALIFLMILPLLFGCDGIGLDKPGDNHGQNGGDNNDEYPLPELPELEDVCTAMDDINFMGYCYDNFDVNKDGKVSKTEANAVKEIELNTDTGVKSLVGIEYFHNLQVLKCRNNKAISKIPLRYNKNLNSIDCSNCTALDYFESPKEVIFNIYKTTFYGCYNLKTVVLGPISNNPKITYVIFGSNLDSKISNVTTKSSLSNVSFYEGVTEIPTSLLSGYSSNHLHIYLPSSLQTIAKDAFWGKIAEIDASKCTNLKEIYDTDVSVELFILGANVPPSIGSGFDIKTLKVPASSIEAYKASDWAKFCDEIIAL